MSLKGRPSSFLTSRSAILRFAALAIALVASWALQPSVLHAQNIVRVTGYIQPGQTRYFYPRVPNNSALDTIYYISGDVHVAGKLQISEGAEVWFLDNSRLIDSAGGKIIANGYAPLPGMPNVPHEITFRGAREGDTAYEWGHIVILPNSDSAYFSFVHFTNFRKRNSVDRSTIYNPQSDPTDATYNNAINNAMNGVGGVIVTFSHKTYIYQARVDTCQASFAGGAFAFLQAPAGFTPPDDGRLALASKQVGLLTIRDTRVYNAETNNNFGTSTTALGGAIYMASNNSQFVASNNVTAFLGHNGFVTGTPQFPVVFSPTQDLLLFERCRAQNTFSNSTSNFAKGGAIYVGSNTGLVLSEATFNDDSAIMPSSSLDLNSWGGAIAVNSTSGNPNENIVTNGTASDRMPGLAILKTATFNRCVAGAGGAIHLDNPTPGNGVIVPRLIINGENIVSNFPGFSGPVRDSGLVLFENCVAYTYGGAIYSPNQCYITGYLAPSSFAYPGGIDSVELRVKFFNNVAGQGGGSIFMDINGIAASNAGGNPDLVERRSWHLMNSVNPGDSRVNRPTYVAAVIGGGAEYISLRDSTAATEYNSNFVVGGDGGAVDIQDGVSSVSGNTTPINRYFVENEYNPQNLTTPRDTGSLPGGAPIYSIFPYDQRELTRFVNNAAYLGPDSASLYSYDPNRETSAYGRGGAIYVRITNSPSNVIPFDSLFLSRVRIEHNEAYSGSAIWCDRFDFRVMSTLCLIANNIATSTSSATVDFDSSNIANPGDPNAGATIWADFEGPVPSYNSNSRGDAIYDNIARYIVRLPASLINGLSGTDTMRGNFWGETGAGVETEENPPTGVVQATFFIDYYKGCYENIFEPNSNPPVAYQPDKIGTVPDTDLMEGRIYDIYDRGTDIKAADYSNHRLAPSEDFALGLPSNILRTHRFTRNIFDQDPTYVNKIDLYQADFQGPHPIGYPLFLQADISLADSNRDDFARNYTTYFVINTTTDEFVRVNLKETKAAEGAGDAQQTYQGRLDFIPDSSVAERHPNARNFAHLVLGLLGANPMNMTFAEAQRASLYEDSTALKGREYSLSASDLLALGDSVFMNCESTGPLAKTTWYAGEKYHTLPVRPGDQILVISRTMLWKYGLTGALATALQFPIGDVQPPSFVADIPNLASDPYNPNVRFVKRDINYDGHNAATTLFRVAGYDVNNFYDPRFLFNPGNYTQLALTVGPDMFKGDIAPSGPNYIPANVTDSLKNHVRLNSWLTYDTVFNQNITGSNGYIQIKGTPKNPDIVPGGEWLTATITNFPPDYNSENLLLQAFPGTLGPDANALSLWLYPPSFNCARVDTTTTVIPNPDSICIRATTSTYHFRIIVQDSLPVFNPIPKSACGFSYPVAILTDSLRYTLDLNTDVESEDSVAAAKTELPATKTDTAHHPAWAIWAGGPNFKEDTSFYRDFPYGRSSYDFTTRPYWMVEPRGGAYVPIDSSDPAFLRSGKINVRIDSITAISGNNNAGGPFLTPANPLYNNGEITIDTVLAIESDDGHTGKTTLTTPVTILFAPTILMGNGQGLPNGIDTLAAGKEGIDYSLNYQHPDSVRRIFVQNLNPNHPLTYTLLYHGDTEYLYKDAPDKVPFIIDGGSHKVGGAADTIPGYTPRWLHIDPYSGVLSGVPGDTDAPRVAGTSCGGDTVTVVVSDGTYPAYCVSAYVNLLLNVDSVNHPPHFVKGPTPICVANNTNFCDTITVYDPDLLRNSCAGEVLNLSDSNGFTITPNRITGQLQNDSMKFTVCGTFNMDAGYFQDSLAFPPRITLYVTDSAGLMDTLSYPVHIGALPAFECSICIANAVTPLHPLQDIQHLYFGGASDATDSLDQQYCEYELAPKPPLSTFDARWQLPDTTSGQSFGLEGTTIDVRKTPNATSTGIITWQVQFQPGNEGGGAGSLYPVEICWNRSCLDPKVLPTPWNGGHFYLKNPNSDQEFAINMFTGQGPVNTALYTLIPEGSDSECLQIRDQGLTNAYIEFIPANSGVGTQSIPTFAIEPNYPNPFAGTTTLNFSVATRSNVRIDIFDVKGSLIRTLENEQLDAGSYPITWDGTDASGAMVADGAYVATMTAGSFTGSVKMTLERTNGQ